MDVRQYLNRIRYQGSLNVDIDTLRQLHRCHLQRVPFENLDILLGTSIELDLESSFDKIVNRHRGGFCYELNGLFGWLLESIGFDVGLLSACVYNNGVVGAKFAHLMLLVRLNEHYIADIGFGDSFSEPMPLDPDISNIEANADYRLQIDASQYVLQRRTQAGWEPQYVFDLSVRQLDDFQTMCHYQQKSAESHFTQGIICSLATDHGRITVSGNQLINTTKSQREVTDILTSNELGELLSRHFGISLNQQELDLLYQPVINL